ncbi:MAG TPA: hypothetical protein VEG65_07510 [Candidatus Bathyarchaeia archaeon]|nr:hypothetical protein [Candidatus Bathyarchaeia archaeon]
MTKFFVKWWADSTRIPSLPQEAMELRLNLIGMVKADLSSGKMTEWGTFGNGKDGYIIIDGTEQDVFSTMLKYRPAVLFDVYPVLSADDYKAAAKKAAEAMQA